MLTIQKKWHAMFEEDCWKNKPGRWKVELQDSWQQAKHINLFQAAKIESLIALQSQQRGSLLIFCIHDVSLHEYKWVHRETTTGFKRCSHLFKIDRSPHANHNRVQIKTYSHLLEIPNVQRNNNHKLATSSLSFNPGLWYVISQIPQPTLHHTGHLAKNKYYRRCSTAAYRTHEIWKQMIVHCSYCINPKAKMEVQPHLPTRTLTQGVTW